MAGVHSNYVDTDDSSIVDSDYTGGRNYFGLGLGYTSGCILSHETARDNVGFDDDYAMHDIQGEQSGQVIHDAEMIIENQETPEWEEMSQNSGMDPDATQCEQVEEIISQRSQRTEKHKTKV